MGDLREDNYDSPESELVELRNAGFSDEEIQEHFETTYEVEEVDNSTQETQNQQVQSEDQDPLVLIDELKAAGFSKDEIAEHIRETGLAAPQYEDEPVSAEPVSAEPVSAEPVSAEPVSDEQPKEKVADLKPRIDQALNDGVTKDEIRDYLLSEGYGDEALDLLGYTRGEKPPSDDKVKAQRTKDFKALEAAGIPSYVGIVLDVISPTLNSMFGVEKDKRGERFEEGKPRGVVHSASELSAAVNNAHGTLTQLMESTGIVGEEKKAIAKEARANMNNLVVENLIEAGYVAFIDDSGTPAIKLDDGSVQKVDSGFWNSLKASKFETIGGIVAEEVTRRGMKGKIKSPITGFATLAAGTAVGVMGGKYLDLAHDAAVMSEKFETDFMLEKSLQAAGEGAVLGAVVGTGINALKPAVKGTLDIINKLPKAMDSVQVSKARKALKEREYLFDEEANSIIEAATSRGVKLAGDTETEKYISALVHLDKRQFSQNVAKGALGDAKVAQTTGLVNTIDQRAKTALTYLKDLNKESDPMTIKKAYDDYESTIKKTYGMVKDAATDLAPNYKFNMKKAILEPLEKELIYGKLNDRKAEMFSRMLDKLELTKKSRSVGDLLDLVQMTNQVKFQKATSYDSKQKLNGVLNSLHSEINKAITKESGSKTASKWAKDFKQMNTHYSKMLSNRSNAIVKVLSKRSIAPADIESVLTKYRDSPDVIAEAMTGLPPQISSQVDMTYYKMLTEKYGITKSLSPSMSPEPDDLQAIDWVKLNNTVKATQPRSSEGKQYKHLVNQYAQIFRADPKLMQYSSKGSKMEASSVMHSDAENAARARFLSKSFDTILRYMPTEKGRMRALVHVTSKVLNAPTDAKAVERAVRLMPKQGRDEFKASIDALQQNYKQSGSKPKPPTVSVKPSNGFKATKHGRGSEAVISKNGGVEIPASNILDVSKMPKSSVEDLVSSNHSLRDRGYTAIYDGKKMYFLDAE